MKKRISISLTTALICVLALSACEDESTAPNQTAQPQQATLAVSAVELTDAFSLNYESSFPFPNVTVDTGSFIATHDGVQDNPSFTLEFDMAIDPTSPTNPSPFENEPILTSLSMKWDNMFCRDTLYWGINPPSGVEMNEAKLTRDADISFTLKHGHNYSTLKYPDEMETSNFKIESVWLAMWNDSYGPTNQVTFSQTISFDYIISFIDKRLASGQNRYYFYGSGSVTP